jgi:hypothetical protein
MLKPRTAVVCCTTLALALGASAAHGQDAAQNFGFDACLFVDGKAPSGPWDNCVVTSGFKSLAECEKGRKIAEQKGLTTATCTDKPIDPRLRAYLSENMKTSFSDDASQEVLRDSCPDVPTDRVIVACSAVTTNSEGLVCHILFAPENVIVAHSRWRRDLSLYLNQYNDCIRIVADKLEALGKTIEAMCIVNDPTGTPLNVRASPRGKILDTVSNGTNVVIVERRGKWTAIVIPVVDHIKDGWVFHQFLQCD